MKKAVLFLVLSTAALAKDKAHAPLPDAVMKAKTVYFDNEGSTSSFDKAYSEFQKWGKYSVVTSKETADLTIVFTTGSKLIDGTAYPNTTMKVFPKDAGQAAFEATNTWPKKCVEEFRKRLSEN